MCQNSNNMNPDLTQLHNGSATDGKPVVLDQLETTVYRGIYVGSGGHISGVLASGATVTLNNCQEGAVYPFSFKQINTSGTTALNLVLLR